MALNALEEIRFGFHSSLTWYKCQLEKCYESKLITSPLHKFDYVLSSFCSGRIFDAILRRYSEEYLKTIKVS